MIGALCALAGVGVGYFVGTYWDSIVAVKKKVCDAVQEEFSKKE
jgi:hypothetical protein